MTTTQATLKNLGDLATLFDGYRAFYRQDFNLEAAKRFLKQRMIKNDSIIYDNDQAIGYKKYDKYDQFNHHITIVISFAEL